MRVAPGPPIGSQKRPTSLTVSSAYQCDMPCREGLCSIPIGVRKGGWKYLSFQSTWIGRVPFECRSTIGTTSTVPPPLSPILQRPYSVRGMCAALVGAGRSAFFMRTNPEVVRCFMRRSAAIPAISSSACINSAGCFPARGTRRCGWSHPSLPRRSPIATGPPPRVKILSGRQLTRHGVRAGPPFLPSIVRFPHAPPQAHLLSA
jgi:hypothetical protein